MRSHCRRHNVEFFVFSALLANFAAFADDIVAATTGEACNADDPSSCAARSSSLMQMRTQRMSKSSDERDEIEELDKFAESGEIDEFDESAEFGETGGFADSDEAIKGGKGRGKGGKGRESTPRPRPRPRPSYGEVSYGEDRGPGTAWTEEEALTVMAKVIWTIKNTAFVLKQHAKAGTDIFGGLECAAGPNFTQECDDKFNEYCHVLICKADNSPDLNKMQAKFLRLGFHDCLKYTDGTGGCDGCLEFGPMFGKYVQLHGFKNQRFGNRLRLYNDGEDVKTGNSGLATPADILEEIYTNADFPSGAAKLSVSLKDSGKSRADLWAFAAMVSAEFGMNENNLKCAGKSKIQETCENTLQHAPVKYACEITPPASPPRFYTGRSDCPTASRPKDPMTSSRVPHRGRQYETVKAEKGPSPYMNGTMLADFFRSEFGLNRRETVAIMGAHALGGFSFEDSMFKYRWQFGNDFLLNNNYYRNVAKKPGMKQICGKGKAPPTWAGKPGGKPAETGWWVRPLRELPSGGPFLWFHYYHRCPTCYKDEKGEWHTTEQRGEGKYRKVECCKCNEQDEADVDPECLQKITHDETAISVDVGLYHQFEVADSGAPLGCPGLKPDEWSVDRLTDTSLDGKTKDKGGINTWDTEPQCPKNNDKDADDDMAMSDYVELYADDQNTWVADFWPVLEKIVSNGYSGGELTEGPNVLGMGRTTCDTNKKRIFTCAFA